MLEEKQQEYLRALSQSTYNLIQIVRTHWKEPVEIDKELIRYFTIEKENLKKLLKQTTHGIKFKFDTGVLKVKLISSYNGVGGNNVKSAEAIDKLSDLLAKIEEKRQGTVMTGVDDSLLKSRLDYLNTKKDEETDQTILRRQKAPELRFMDSRILLQKTKNIEIRKFPEGLTWEEITIRFLNSEEVQIKIREEIYQTTAELMGFQSEKSKKPILVWELLRLLAIKGGTLNWDNNMDLTTKEINKVSKKVQILSEKMMDYFHTIKTKPFPKYKKEVGYKIKIKLIPEPNEGGRREPETIESLLEDDGGDEE